MGKGGVGWAIALAATLGALWVAFGVRRVAQPVFAGPDNVVSLPFGEGSHAVGLATGMDRQPYGPLAFAVAGGEVVIADTWHHRLLVVGAGGAVRAIPLPAGMVPEDVACMGPLRCYVVDGRGGTVWSTGSSAPAVGGGTQAGVTVALRQLALTRSGHLVLDTLAVGRGQLLARVAVYDSHGKLVRLLGSRRWVDGVQASTEGIGGPFADVAMAPSDRLYAVAGRDPQGRWRVREYRLNGRPEGGFAIGVAADARPHLLGVDRRGLAYVLVDAAGGERRLLAVNGLGRVVASTAVGKSVVKSRIWGRVTPGGECYLVESGARDYRIVRFKVVTRYAWQWWPWRQPRAHAAAPGWTRPATRALTR